MNLQRLMLGLPILIIHSGGIEQQNYYTWFRRKKCYVWEYQKKKIIKDYDKGKWFKQNDTANKTQHGKIKISRQHCDGGIR